MSRPNVDYQRQRPGELAWARQQVVHRVAFTDMKRRGTRRARCGWPYYRGRRRSVRVLPVRMVNLRADGALPIIAPTWLALLPAM